METTIETRLRKLRMPGMSACWQTWVETKQTSQLSLEDGMQLLLQAEEDARRVNRNARLVHNARFRYPACLEELTFDSQVPVSEWYEILSANTTAADAILDRLVHSANRITLKGGSLRK